MATIGRRDLILFLIGLDPHGELGDEVNGMTRLQKLLFLLEKEAGLRATGEGFEFEAWKAGPYSSRLYDDLEFLENLDLVSSESTAEATDAEASEMELEEAAAEDVTFEELMGDSPGKQPDPDTYEERRFRLTPKGLQRVERMIQKGEYKPVADGIRKIKSKYASHSLNDLLYHVYTKYPEMTVESEIKEKVLGRHRG